MTTEDRNKTKYEQLRLDLTDKPRQIVKYKTNEDSGKLFNHIKGYSAVKSDIVMFILANALRNGQKNITFSPNQLKKFIGYRRTISSSEFLNTISWIFEDLASVIYKSVEIKNGEEHEINRPFFDFTDINRSTHWVTVRVSEEAAKIFNDFSKNSRFNRFSLLQYFRITSKYSKNLFRLLKQWRTKGHCSFTVEELRDELDIPNSYKTSDINRRIIKRSLEDLLPYFADYKVEIDNLRSTKPTQYIFTWKREEHTQKDAYIDQKIPKLLAFYNINNNSFASSKLKNKAIDRYFKLSPGTYIKKSKQDPYYFMKLIYGPDEDHSLGESIKHLQPKMLDFLMFKFEHLKDKQKLDEKGLATLNLLETESFKRDKNGDDHILDLTGLPVNIEINPTHQSGLTYLSASKRIKALEFYSRSDLNILLQRYVKALSRKPNDPALLQDIGILSNYLQKQ